MQNCTQIRCSTRSVILNVTATQYTCSLNGVYRPHWLVQWSHHCSRMCIPVHSPWLPAPINVMQTVLVILTMAGLFPDIPCILDKLSNCHLYFNFVCGLLLYRAFDFYGLKFASLFFNGFWITSYSERPVLPQDYDNSLLCFFSSTFIVWFITFRPLIHLEFILDSRVM